MTRAVSCFETFTDVKRILGKRKRERKKVREREREGGASGHYITII